MAVYKGREVTLLGPASGEDASPMYTIMDKKGERSIVKLSEVMLTDEELQKSKDGYVEGRFNTIAIIEDKDLQELRDGQDKQKIEAKQGKVAPGPVEVSKVWVDPAEVKEKSTPVVTPTPAPEVITVTDKPVPDKVAETPIPTPVADKPTEYVPFTSTTPVLPNQIQK